jgi:hypothetical protein
MAPLFGKDFLPNPTLKGGVRRLVFLIDVEI